MNSPPTGTATSSLTGGTAIAEFTGATGSNGGSALSGSNAQRSVDSFDPHHHEAFIVCPPKPSVQLCRELHGFDQVILGPEIALVVAYTGLRSQPARRAGEAVKDFAAKKFDFLR